MTEEDKVSAVFNRFAGQEVGVIKTSIGFHRGAKGLMEEFDYRVASNDPTVKAMEKAAADNGFLLHVSLPSILEGGVSSRKNLVQAIVEEDGGKFRVKKVVAANGRFLP